MNCEICKKEIEEKNNEKEFIVCDNCLKKMLLDREISLLMELIKKNNGYMLWEKIQPCDFRIFDRMDNIIFQQNDNSPMLIIYREMDNEAKTKTMMKISKINLISHAELVFYKKELDRLYELKNEIDKHLEKIEKLKRR